MTVVTHVFTDIVGSTRLWEAQPERMAVALAAHDALAKAVVTSHAGRVVKTTGDGWHAVFDDPVDALRAACAFQLALPDATAGGGLALSDRCGLHAGPAQARDGDYYGSTVNRAARIMSVAHGGQVLTSSAVADAAAARLPAPLALRGLGRVRLRDLALADELHQLVHPRLPQDFPPLRGLDATPNNLPYLASSFIGRAGAVAEIVQALVAHRLVTITGPGGIGKTRLALHAGADVLERFDDGVWQIELAGVADDAGVERALAQALGVQEQAHETLRASIVAFLAGRRTLVVLDNCEHLLDACAALADALLRGTPATRILATSREPLHVDGELVYAVPALSLPPVGGAAGAEAALRSPAVALFVERAREQAPAFVLTDANAAAVANVCRQLDGLPLALELAATRVRALSPDELERRLADRFHLLASGQRTALPRHRTLDALITWSYELLDARERALFDRLGVFAGGFDLAAAEAVGAAPPVNDADVVDLVASLVDKSLVVAEIDASGNRTRYRMMDTLRAFALRRLDSSGEATSARERHAAHFTNLANAVPPESDGEGRGRYLARMDAEVDNLRAALAWTMSRPGDGGAAAELVLALYDFWHERGHIAESVRCLDAALALPVAASQPLTRARLANKACVAATRQNRLADATRHAETALAGFRECGTSKDIVHVLERQGEIAGRQGDFERSDALLREALSIHRAEGDRVNEAKVLCNLGTIWSEAGDFARTMAYAEEAAAIAREIGLLNVQAYAELNLATVHIESERPAQARSHYQRVLEIAGATGDRYLEPFGRGGLAQVELALGNVEVAHALSLEVLEPFVASAMHREVAMTLDDIAHALAVRGAIDVAGRLFAAAEQDRGHRDIQLAPSERARLDGRIAAARAAAGRDAFVKAWKDGEAMSIDDAVALARSTPLPAGRERAAPQSAVRR